MQGSGPAGQRAAIYGAKLGKRVAVVEERVVGSACIHTGTIPSKTMREAVLAHSGEALQSRMAFQALSNGDRDAIIEFLKSLQILPPKTRELVLFQR